MRHRTPRRKLAPSYPTPETVGLKVPPHLRADRFSAGFDHGVKGGQLDNVDYFRLSFRLGFRAAKLYLRELRRQNGVVEFPRWRMRQATHWDH